MELKKTTRFTPLFRAASYTLADANTLSGISVSQPMSGRVTGVGSQVHHGVGSPEGR